MGGCGKGELWVNEFMLGAYWSIRYTENPAIFSQRYYHMPRDYLAPPGENNLVIVYEEIGCDPRTIRLMQRNATTVSHIASS
jgi:beta-galactosidase